MDQKAVAPIPMRTETPFGRIIAYKTEKGERYYFLIDKHKTVSYMPESALEQYRK